MLPLTFDWAQIAYIGSPLLTPWWAAANIVTGLVVVIWIIAPILCEFQEPPIHLLVTYNVLKQTIRMCFSLRTCPSYPRLYLTTRVTHTM